MKYEEWKRKYNIRLNEQQEKAVLAVDGSILLLAVPGSGKTTVIVARVGYMLLCKDILPENILTLTYSVASARNMKERFENKFNSEIGEKLNFRTINSFCCDVIRYYERMRETKKFDLITDKLKYKIISDIYKQVENNFPTEAIISDIISKITYIKNLMLTDAEIQEIEYEDANIYEIYKKYKEYNEANKLMDFDDQLVYAYIILKNLSNIREFFIKKYKYINVDEAQDTSKIQHEIINLIVNGNIFMVGDEDQSIYKFRGAYPEALLQFEKRYNNSKVLLMETNYRSTPDIVQIANKHIKKNKARKDKNMTAYINSSELIVKNEVNNLNDQYEYLLNSAKQYNDKSLAIIYRNNDSAIPIIWLFKENNIDFTLKGGEITFFSHKIVRDIKSYIRFITNLNDIEAFKEIYYKLGCGINKNMLDEVVNKLRITKEQNSSILEILLKTDIPKWQHNKILNIMEEILFLKNEKPYRIISSILNDLGYKDYLSNKDKENNKKLPAIYEQKINILYYIAKKNNDINGFLASLEYVEKLCKDNDNVQSNVTLTTIHSSKGLEFDKVILIDMNQGIIPCAEQNSSSKNKKNADDDYEEDVRLFYVAITRAKEQLEILNCKSSANNQIVISEFVKSMFKKESTNPFLSILKEKNILHKDISAFKVGDKVKNLTFGIGKILEIKNDTAKVKFDKGIKNMMLHYLTKI